MRSCFGPRVSSFDAEEGQAHCVLLNRLVPSTSSARPMPDDDPVAVEALAREVDVHASPGGD